MARPQARAVASQPESSPVASTTWAQWPSTLQVFQLHAARDMLDVFNRYVGALVAARDAQAVGDAQRAVIGEWMACIEGIQRQWTELARAVPPEAWAVCGWRLKAAACAPAAVDCEGPPNFFEQSKLGIEMLLRPWLPAPDLEHTDEFVA
jgi:hypothetical protein